MTSVRPARWCARVMDNAARDRLVSNVVGPPQGNGVKEPVLSTRVPSIGRNIDKTIGDRIAKGRQKANASLPE